METDSFEVRLLILAALAELVTEDVIVEMGPITGLSAAEIRCALCKADRDLGRLYAQQGRGGHVGYLTDDQLPPCACRPEVL